MSSAAANIFHFDADGSGEKSKKIKLVIVEDHNEVLPHIYRSIGSKKLPYENGAIIHLDSHPDLMVQEKFDPSRIYDKEYVFNSISIESWILPAVYAKHFSSVAWIKPPWSEQLKNGLYRFKVGCHKTLKEIKVTSTQSYFVGELTWSPVEELEEPVRDLLLQVLTLVPEKWGPLTDKVPSEIPSSEISSDLQDHLKQDNYVLDIDLDFYSTRNPFLSLFTKEQLKWLSNFYHYDHPGDNVNKEILKKVTDARKTQLQNLKNLLFRSSERDISDPELLSMKEVFPDGLTEDPEILLGAGCTCSECTLPHHVSNPDQVLDLVKTTKSFLSTLPKSPALITIARSSLDDYCPPEDVDFIQESVLQMLQEVYGPLKIFLDYDTKK